MTSLILMALLAQQPVPPPTQVVIPTYQSDRVCWAAQPCQPGASNLCWNLVNCEGPLPAGSPMPPQLPPPCGQADPCARGERVSDLRVEMRSKPLFWTGIGAIAGGVVMAVAATTWARESETTAYAAAPCGTDPVLVRGPIAPCRANSALLAAGAALAGGGAVMVWYGGSKVLVGTDGRQVTVRVRF